MLLAFAGLGVAASAAMAEPCGDNPHVLGTERTIAVEPWTLPRVGTFQFAQTLPLGDHEVVLTFDDGPSPETTGKVLDALAAECVKANFFLVGEHAVQAPALVRREAREGHTVGTHTQSHPDLAKLKPQEAEAEINDGIAAAAAALDGEAGVAPFFRAPYLVTNPAIDAYLRATWIPRTGATTRRRMCARVFSTAWRGRAKASSSCTTCSRAPRKPCRLCLRNSNKAATKSSIPFPPS
jgi:peptidoglycan/xylan/chitin deacetylase (PgdA/CDA1 family)